MSRWLTVRIHVDRAAAALAVLVLLPALGASAVVVLLGEGRPVWIQLPRVGRGGAVFGMWKLRSMRVGADTGGGAITASDDDRFTRTGPWLRRHRLDELPQVVNVVRGEMALVGPRPETPALVERDDRWVAVLRCPPGIAGPTQVLVHRWERELLRGPGIEQLYRDVILPVKLAIDRWYVLHATPLIDILVIGALTAGFPARWCHRRLDAMVRDAVPEAVDLPPAA